MEVRSSREMDTDLSMHPSVPPYLCRVVDEGQILALEDAKVVNGAAAVAQDQLVRPALLSDYGV